MISLREIPGIVTQRDPRWANEILGTNSPSDTDQWGRQFTIGNYGCLITAAANMFWTADPANQTTMNPGLLNQQLILHNGFVDGGSVVWDALPPMDNNVTSHGVTYDIHALADWVVQDDCYALVQVTAPNFPMHFVGAWGYTTSLRAIDPWYGDDFSLDEDGRYTFVAAHLYSLALPAPQSPVTDPQPTAAPPTPVTPDAPTTPPAVPSEPQPPAQPEPTPPEPASSTPTVPVPQQKPANSSHAFLNWLKRIIDWILGRR